jgi:transposase-like protein
MTKTPQMRCIEAERGESLETILARAVEQGKTWDDIALDLGVSRLTLRDWTRRMGAELVTKRSLRFKEKSSVLVG